MYLGKLVEVGPADSILTSPVHPYTAGLLEAVPVPNVSEARSRRGRQIKGELPSPVNPPSGCRFRTRCPRAEERCSVDEPEFQEFANGVRAACHFPLSQPVSIASSANAQH